MGYDDDDDWVGTPPEGRYTSDRAKPEFWLNQRPAQYAMGGLGVLVVVLILVIVLG